MERMQILFFSYTGCLTKAKELNYFPIAGGAENKWIHPFLNGINAKCNANNLVQDLNSGCQFHFLRQ